MQRSSYSAACGLLAPPGAAGSGPGPCERCASTLETCPTASGRKAGVSRNGSSWEISSLSRVVCDRMGGQRAGRANRAPGRCLAGEGVAWRHYLTGRLVSLAYNSFLRSRRDSGRLALLAVHFLPELGRGFAVDRLQSVERTQECAVALALEIAVDVLERHPFERRRIGHACTDP